MDIFCLSSDTEGLSISLLEAGACGLPSVVTHVGGNTEIVADGISGCVVPRRDENALAAALARLADDTALRQTMGQEARRIVEGKYSLTVMVDRYLRVYLRVSAPRN
jgi:glycosyltransferase involved in cell wall biosynthesis